MVMIAICPFPKRLYCNFLQFGFVPCSGLMFALFFLYGQILCCFRQIAAHFGVALFLSWAVVVFRETDMDGTWMSDEGFARRVADAVSALAAGGGVLLVDDADRENEGDLIFAASEMTVEQMALMIRSCSGIVCLCMESDAARRLALPPMVSRNTSRFGTAFTVSVEASRGVTTGVSAADRLTTVRAAIADGAVPDDLARPGHVFPLVSRENGVLSRGGHTEGSVDLVKLAGLPPFAVLCELMNADGTMARLPQIEAFSRVHGFPVVSVADVVAVRRRMRA